VKAAVVEAPNRLVVRDLPEPRPGDYQALCELLYGATCSGTDSHIIDGSFPWISPLPTVLGHESVGRVVEVGPKVRHLKPGDLIPRVGTTPMGGCSVTWGGFAEFGIATDFRAAQEDGLPPQVWGGARMQRVLPPGTDPAEATMFTTWRETLSYATRLGVAEGTSVLVLGSGGNGLSYITHAANAGAAPCVMIGSPVREAAARKAGATDFFDYAAAGVKEAVAKACPDGFDFAIDAVGKAGLADLGLSLLKPGGTIGIYGIDDYGKCRLDPGRSRGTFTYFNGGYDEAETHERVVELYQAGKLDASVWLDLAHPFELGQIVEAFEAVRARKVVKALVRLRG